MGWPGETAGARGRFAVGGGGSPLGVDSAAPRSRGPRRLATPRQVKVEAGEGGRPRRIGDREVEAVRESWLVEDRWWTDRPVRRRYWEIVTVCGRDVVVYHDLVGGGWFIQR
jgi:hypothetical protein